MNNSKTGAGVLLREVARMYSRAQRVVADCCQTTGTQCHLLTELGRSGPQSQTELGARLCLEKSWVSRAIDTMVSRGLVTKEPNPDDARSWLVTLTAVGERTVDDLNRTLDSHSEQLLEALNSRERAAVENCLELLIKALREDAAANCCLPSATKKESKSCC
jgi:DNA-binding MarR family transcriptional regulator